jgi:hypothetical protein
MYLHLMNKGKKENWSPQLEQDFGHNSIIIWMLQHNCSQEEAMMKQLTIQ